MPPTPAAHAAAPAPAAHAAAPPSPARSVRPPPAGATPFALPAHRAPPRARAACRTAFELLFGSTQNTENDDLLIDLINSCLSVRPPVVSVRRRSTATMPVALKRHRVRLWLEAADAAGGLALLELRFTAEPEAADRQLHTWMALHAAQLGPRQAEEALLPVRCLWFSARAEGPAPPAHAPAPWCAAERLSPLAGVGLLALPDLSLVSLPRVRRSASDAPAHRWLRFLAEAEAGAPIAGTDADPLLQRAQAVLEAVEADPVLRLHAEAARIADARRAEARLELRGAPRPAEERAPTP